MSTSLDSSCCDQLGLRPVDIVRPAEVLEPLDEARGAVDLSGTEPVARRAGEGVVVVVPRLTHREDREGREVRADVARRERPLPEAVADGVHRPRAVERDADRKSTRLNP